MGLGSAGTLGLTNLGESIFECNTVHLRVMASRLFPFPFRARQSDGWSEGLIC